MKILFGLITGVALTLAFKAQPTPIAVAVSSLGLGVVSTLFVQAEFRPRRRAVRIRKKQLELPMVVRTEGGKAFIRANKAWSKNEH